MSSSGKLSDSSDSPRPSGSASSSSLGAGGPGWQTPPRPQASGPSVAKAASIDREKAKRCQDLLLKLDKTQRCPPELVPIIVEKQKKVSRSRLRTFQAAPTETTDDAFSELSIALRLKERIESFLDDARLLFHVQGSALPPLSEIFYFAWNQQVFEASQRNGMDIFMALATLKLQPQPCERMRHFRNLFQDYGRIVEAFPHYFRNIIEHPEDVARHKTRNFLFKAIGKSAKIDREEQEKIAAALQPYRQEIDAVASWATARIHSDPYNILAGEVPSQSVMKFLPFLEALTEMTRAQTAWHKLEALRQLELDDAAAAAAESASSSSAAASSTASKEKEKERRRRKLRKKYSKMHELFIGSASGSSNKINASTGDVRDKTSEPDAKSAASSAAAATSPRLSQTALSVDELVPVACLNPKAGGFPSRNHILDRICLWPKMDPLGVRNDIVTLARFLTAERDLERVWETAKLSPGDIVIAAVLGEDLAQLQLSGLENSQEFVIYCRYASSRGGRVNVYVSHREGPSAVLALTWRQIFPLPPFAVETIQSFAQNGLCSPLLNLVQNPRQLVDPKKPAPAASEFDCAAKIVRIQLVAEDGQPRLPREAMSLPVTDSTTAQEVESRISSQLLKLVAERDDKDAMQLRLQSYRLRTSRPGGRPEVILPTDRLMDLPPDTQFTYCSAIEGPAPTASRPSARSSSPANAGLTLGSRLGSRPSAIKIDLRIEVEGVSGLISIPAFSFEKLATIVDRLRAELQEKDGQSDVGPLEFFSGDDAVFDLDTTIGQLIKSGRAFKARRRTSS